MILLFLPWHVLPAALVISSHGEMYHFARISVYSLINFVEGTKVSRMWSFQCHGN